MVNNSKELKNNVVETTSTTTTTNKKIFLAVSGVIIGSIFGYALTKSNVYLPKVIQNQMNFSNMTMLKMFMTAGLTSSLAVTFLNSKKLIVVESLPIMYKRNLLGGLIMGVGIYLTGACPGTVLAQVGASIGGTIWTLVGGVVGASIYGLINPMINKLLPASNGGSTKNATLYEKLGVSMGKVTIPISILMALTLYGIELYFPWHLDSGVSNKSISIFGSFNQGSIWSPYAAGLTIGLLQIPSYLSANNGLGCSSAYVTIGSKVCQSFTCGIDYFKKFNSGARAIYGPLLNVGIIAGAYYASLSNPAPFDQQFNTQSSLSHFLGGAILLFGARLANGCTSGHMTGMAKSELGSFISIASIFAGGILTSYFLNK